MEPPVPLPLSQSTLNLATILGLQQNLEDFELQTDQLPEAHEGIPIAVIDFETLYTRRGASSIGLEMMLRSSAAMNALVERKRLDSYESDDSDDSDDSDESYDSERECLEYAKFLAIHASQTEPQEDEE